MSSPTRHRILVLATACLAGSLPAPGAETTNASDAPGRDYVAFLGLDVSVRAEGRDYPVVSYESSELAIQRGNEQVRMPTREANFKLSVEPKLGRSAVTVADLHAKPVRDAKTDTDRGALMQQMLMDSIQSHNEDMAVSGVLKAAEEASIVQREAAVPNSPVTQQDVQNARAATAQAVVQMDQTFAMPVNTTPIGGGFGASDSSDCDALEVTFRLSTAEEIRDGFGVLRLLLHDRDKPAQSFAVVKFFPLPKAGPTARKVTVLQTGLQPGFTMEGYDIHVYSKGRELPTNVSPNRMDLSFDEAHQFLILRHIQLNKNASIPAEIIRELIPPELRAWIAAIKTDAAIDLDIGRDGRVTGVTAVRGSAELSVASVEDHLRDVRFFPALLKGAPVDSHGTFGLSEFAR